MYKIRTTYHKQVEPGKGLRYYVVIDILEFDEELTSDVLPKTTLSNQPVGYSDDVTSPLFPSIDVLEEWRAEYMSRVREVITDKRAMLFEGVKMPCDSITEI